MSKWIMLMGLMIGCVESSEEADKVASGLSCANSADCPTGELCLEQSCQSVECVTSLDCQLEQYCGESFECVDGCTENTDCLAGDECNVDDNICESYGCRDTILDCGVGEFCNPATAECYADGVNYCDYCTMDDIYYTPPTNGICLFNDVGGSCQVNGFADMTGCIGQEVCFPDDVDEFQLNSIISPTSYIAGTCFTAFKSLYVNLLPQGECPGGFSAQAIQYTDGTVSDPVCNGNCEYYIENGFFQ